MSVIKIERQNKEQSVANVAFIWKINGQLYLNENVNILIMETNHISLFICGNFF